MKATQSSTALMDLVGTVESPDREHLRVSSAPRLLSLRLDLGIVEDASSVDQQDAVQAWVHSNGRDSGSNARLPYEEAMKRHGSVRSSDVIGRDGYHAAPVVSVADGAGLAHDAGNLLSALSLYADMLSLPGVLHDEYREYASELRLLSERSSAMIARLFDHVNQAKEKTGNRLTSLAEVIARCGGLLDRIAGRRVEVSFGREADLLVDVSSEIVERIVINLVKNAAEAIGEGNPGSILVHVSAAGDGCEAGVAVTVEDTGCGMTRDELSTLGAYKTVARGSRGIGFRVVRELAAMSNGCVAIASAPGEGTKVSVEWPSIEQMQIETGERTRRVLRGEAGWIAC
ncbi:MAG: HAMP domain-containing histidine kinase [Acidobacteria bacterium]|nr:HAMP domain-containing histidine kinase [Acidobacteriota bacterium]